MDDALIPLASPMSLDLPPPRRWLGLIVLLSAVFVATLDTFIVFVAIPAIQLSLGATFAEIEFAIAGYALTFAVGMITSGRLGDRFGRRRMFIIGFTAFTVASGLCGLAQSPGSLILFRLLQGVASAILSPQVLAIIRVTFLSPRERAKAFAWMGVSIGLAGVLGQIIGGVVVSANLWGLSWRPVFLINLPVGIIALTAVSFVVEESRGAGVQKLDPVGAVLSAAGLGLLLYPLIAGREAGWPPRSLAMLGASVVVLAIFTAHQHTKTMRRTYPLLDTDLFRDKAFVVGLLLVLIFYATIPAIVLSFSYLAQLGFGLPPLTAALYFSPLAVVFAATSFCAGQLTRHGPRKVLMAGAATCVIGSATVCATYASVPLLTPGRLILAMVLIGAGQGLFMTPVLNAVISSIRDQHAGAAAGVLTTMQRVGGALGVAVLEIPFFTALDRHRANGAETAQAYAAAFSTVMGWIAVMMIVAFGLLWLLPPDRRSKAPAWQSQPP